MSSANYLDIVGIDNPKLFARTKGGEWHTSCPFCGGQDRFVITPNSTPPFAWCRQCDFSGGPVKFLMKRDSLSYREAMKQLGIEPIRKQFRYTSQELRKPMKKYTLSQNHIWQEKMLAFIDYTSKQILHTPDAYQYLINRGLNNEVISEARIGYNPVRVKDLMNDIEITYHQGITIPRMDTGNVCSIEVRILNDPKFKYLSIKGGEFVIYGLDWLEHNDIVIVVESALDALMIRSLFMAHNIMTATAVAAPANGGTHQINRVKNLASHILVCFDADEAGNESAGKWTNMLGQNVTRITPLGKDPGEMYENGTNIIYWLENCLPDGVSFI